MKIIGLGVNNRIGWPGSVLGRYKAGTLTAPVASGTIPSQTVQQGTGVITYTTAVAFTGPVSSWSMTGGAAGITINSSTGVVSVDRAVVAINAYSLSITATNAAGSSSPVVFSLTVTAYSASTIGFRSSLDSGTTGDIYVAKTGNDTTGTGTLGNPFLTIGRAITAATTGQEIKVRSGTYYESFNITSKQLKVSRYGTERVIISGGAPLTGGVACTVADLPEVGSNWANIYKFTVTTASIASGDGRAALVTEGETALPYVMAWTVDPRFPNFTSATDQWFIADEVVSQVNPTPGPGEGLHITGYKLPAVTDLYTQTQIQRGFVHWHGYPNINKQSAVTSYNTTTKIVSFDGVTDGAYLEDNGDQYQKAFAIGNLLPAMSRGSWGFITNGATTTIYVWPLSTGSIASGMQYSTRGSGVTLGTNNEIRGLEFTMQSSAGIITDGMYAISSGGVTKKTNTRIINCRVFNTWRSAYNSYGGIWIGNTDDFVMEDVTIDNSYGSFGMFISGTPSSLAQRMRVRRVRVNGAEKSAARFFSQSNAFVSNLYVVDPSGLAAHANKTNFYEGNDKVIYHNCFFGGASGYMTWQETSRIAVVGCYVPTSYVGSDFRAIVDQNSSTDTPAAILGQSGASYILRNTTVPYWVDPVATTGLSLGKANNMEVTYTVAANNLVGATYETLGTPLLDRVGGNHFTSGSNLGGTNTTSTNSATYTDHLVGDMTYKSTAPIRSAPTTDISAEIAVIKSWFPDISDAEFDKDIYGNTVNWAAVKPGVSNDYDANFGLPPILIDKPKVTGAPVLGGTMGTTPFFIVANPFPTITAKWQNSTDGITWTDISGATGATYTLAAGDVGKFVARLFTGSGISFRSQSSAPVSSSYALGDPTIMATKAFTSASAVTHQDETSTYVSTGKPLMVVVSTRAGSSAPSTVTCTVGTPGRAYGTGTSLTQTGNIRRTQNQTHTFWLAAPSAGSVSVQVQGSLTANSWLIQVYEVASMTSIGTPTTIGATNTGSITSTVTTTATNGGVFYILNRFDGDLATNPVSVTGSDPANTVTTGGTSATLDLAISTVYARAPTSGGVSKTYSWPVDRTAGVLAMELKSYSAVLPIAGLVFATGNSHMDGRDSASGETFAANIYEYNQSGAIVQPVGAILDTGDTSGNHQAGDISPMVSFANSLSAARPDLNRIVFVGNAQGSTGFVDGTWSGNTANHPNRLTTAVTRWNVAKAALEAQGFTVQPIAAVHISSNPDASTVVATDANVTANALVYQNSQSEYVDYLRANLNGVGATFPVIVSNGMLSVDASVGTNTQAGVSAGQGIPFIRPYTWFMDPINDWNDGETANLPVADFDGLHANRVGEATKGRLTYAALARANNNTQASAPFSSLSSWANMESLYDFRSGTGKDVVGAYNLTQGGGSQPGLIRWSSAFGTRVFDRPSGTNRVFFRNRYLPSQYTISARVRFDSLSAAQGLFMNTAGSGSVQQRFFINATNFVAGNAGRTDITTAHGMSINTTYNLAVTYDGTNIRAYKDGVLLGSAVASVTPDQTRGLYIGCQNDVFAGPLLGDMQWAAIYNTALSASQLVDLTSATYNRP